MASNRNIYNKSSKSSSALEATVKEYKPSNTNHKPPFPTPPQSPPSPLSLDPSQKPTPPRRQRPHGRQTRTPQDLKNGHVRLDHPRKPIPDLDGDQRVDALRVDRFVDVDLCPLEQEQTCDLRPQRLDDRIAQFVGRARARGAELGVQAGRRGCGCRWMRGGA